MNKTERIIHLCAAVLCLNVIAGAAWRIAGKTDPHEREDSGPPCPESITLQLNCIALQIQSAPPEPKAAEPVDDPMPEPDVVPEPEPVDDPVLEPDVVPEPDVVAEPEPVQDPVSEPDVAPVPEPVESPQEHVPEKVEPIPKPDQQQVVQDAQAKVQQQASVAAPTSDMNRLHRWLFESVEREKYYPRTARRAGQEGSCLIVVRLDADGTLVSYVVKDTQGRAVFRKAAEKTMSRLVGRQYDASLTEPIVLSFRLQFSLS